MDNETMFKASNLIFASKHDEVIGSLYFYAVENKNVYRGRIRLCHKHGPEISNKATPVYNWMLVNEKGYELFQGKKALKDILNEKNNPPVIYGDLVGNKYGTIQAATGKRVFEIYTNGHHPSRGCLVPADELEGITDEVIKTLLDTINANSGDVVKDNEAILKLTLPACLKQERGSYGC